ncbi:MAG: phosphate ABC transporter permease PstA [Gammaproteobacteria bacterium]
MTTGNERATARQLMEAGLDKRYARERRFRLLGLIAVWVGLIFLVLFFASIVASGYKAFVQSQVALDVYLDPDRISPGGTTDPQVLATADYSGIVRQSLYELFPEVSGRRDRRALGQLVSVGGAYRLQDIVTADPGLIGERIRVWVPASADVDMVMKGNIDRTLPEESRPVNDRELSWIDRLEESGRLQLKFNKALFLNGDSREPELAGIRGALMGSFYMLLVTLVLAFPVGVAAAIYLEEFAPRNRWTDLIEVNINNLAAVPSIVFGLLGLAVFINWVSLPRSSPLVGGLVLSLMTLPVIIIAARASIKSVPPSIKEAALGLGASRMQMVFQHVLPLALPGILTGTIIGMARALGETAPLLMIGMVAFIVDVPQGPLDPSAALPVQIYLWADSPERAFVERTSAAIIVLLGFLLLMNLTAVLLRRRFERSW